LPAIPWPLSNVPQNHLRKDNIMKALYAAAFLAASAAGLGAANAMPVAPASSGSDVIHVAQGCGPGFHRGPYGRCRANRVVVVRPPVVRKCRYWGPGRRVCRTWW
jgi:hypothetical protein